MDDVLVAFKMYGANRYKSHSDLYLLCWKIFDFPTEQESGGEGSVCDSDVYVYLGYSALALLSLLALLLDTLYLYIPSLFFLNIFLNSSITETLFLSIYINNT